MRRVPDEPYALQLAECYGMEPADAAGRTALLSRPQIREMVDAVGKAHRAGRVPKKVARRELGTLALLQAWVEEGNGTEALAVIKDPYPLRNANRTRKKAARARARESRRRNRPRKKRARR